MLDRARSVGAEDPRNQEPGRQRDRHALGLALRDDLRSAAIPAQPDHLAEHHVQALTLDILHRVVVDSVMLTHVEDRDDVGVVQQGGGPGLALEPDQLDVPRVPIERQHFHRHVPAEALLHGLVDHSHAAPAQFPEEAVVSQSLGHRPVASRPLRAGPRADRARCRASPSSPGPGTALGSPRPARGIGPCIRSAKGVRRDDTARRIRGPVR